MPVLIIKHRLEFGGTYFASRFAFSDVKAFRENNFTNKKVSHQATIEGFLHLFNYTDRMVDCFKSFATAPVVCLFGINNSKLVKILTFCNDRVD